MTREGSRRRSRTSARLRQRIRARPGLLVERDRMGQNLDGRRTTSASSAWSCSSSAGSACRASPACSCSKVRSIAILKCVGSTTSRILRVHDASLPSAWPAASRVCSLAASLPGCRGWSAMSRSSADGLRSDRDGRRAGARDRPARVGALLARAAARHPPREARAAPATGCAGREAVRLAEMGRDGAVAAALVGVAAWQAGSLTVGLVFRPASWPWRCLHLAGIVLVWRSAGHARSFALRHAVLSGPPRKPDPGHPPRRRARCVLHHGCKNAAGKPAARLLCPGRRGAPDMFLIDVQPAQREGHAALLDSQNGAAPAPRLIPCSGRAWSVSKGGS